MPDRKLKLEIEVDDKGSVHVKQFSDKAERELKNVGRAVDAVDKKNKASIATWKKLAVTAGSFFAVSKITSWMKDWVRLAGQQQQSMAGMEQAMRSMGRYTPELHSQLIQTAKDLQTMTTFGDEATIEGQKFLLTYREIGDDVLPHASKVMLDLAALMGGDTKQAANMLGKASMGLSGELRRVGITIDEDIAKSGDFSKILGEIEKQVGGQAQALASTGYGGLQQLSNLWGDTKEDLGELVLEITKGLLPALKSWATELSKIARYWKEVLTGPDEDEMIRKHLQKQERATELALGRARTDAANKNPTWLDNALKKALGFAGYRTKAEAEAIIPALEQQLATVQQTLANLGKPIPLPKSTTGAGGGAGGAGGFRPTITASGGSAFNVGRAPMVSVDLSASRTEFLKEQQAIKKQLLSDAAAYESMLQNMTGKQAEAVNTITDAWRAGADEWLGYTKDAFGQMQEFAYDTAQAMQSAFSEFFFDAFTGELKTLNDYLQSFLKSIARAASNILSQMAVQGIIGLFKGGGATPAIEAGGGMLTGGGFNLLEKAAGGPVSAGGAYLVGEKGPELFLPRQSGSVVPNSQLGAAPSVVINITNNSGQPMKTSQSGPRFNGRDYIIDVIMDAAEHNQRGAGILLGRTS